MADDPRIEAAARKLASGFGYALSDDEEMYDTAYWVKSAERILRAADEADSEWLTTEECEALLRWLNGTTPQIYPADVADGRLLDRSRAKLRRRLEREEEGDV